MFSRSVYKLNTLLVKLTAEEISKIIQGEIQGDANVLVSSFGNIKDAKKGAITFLLNKKYEQYIKSTNASVIITPKIKLDTDKTIIKVNNPVKKFSEIIDILQPQDIRENIISRQSQIHKNSKIGERVSINDFCVIKKNVKIGPDCLILPNTFIGENVTIQANCQIGPNVTIYKNCIIGKKCMIHAGAVIGSDGFGFAENNGTLSKMPQTGRVVIGNEVEIGANTTIDRGTFEDTTIGNGVKLDNLIQIGHNVMIGENTVIAAQCGIAGSTKIGKNCMLGGQVAVADHINIGDNVKIAGKSGVIKNVKNNQVLQGPLAFEIKDFQKSYVHFKNLDTIIQELHQLKKKVNIAKNNTK